MLKKKLTKLSNNIVVISSHPLPKTKHSAIHDLFGNDALSLELSTLRAIGAFSAFAYLRSQKTYETVLIVENATATFYLDTLVICSVFIRSNYTSIYFIEDDQRLDVSYALILASFFRLLWGVLGNASSYLRALFELNLATPDIQYRPLAFKQKSCLYINSNLMYGVWAGGSLGHIKGVVNALVARGYDVHYASTNILEGLRPEVINHKLRCKTRSPMPIDWALFNHNFDLFQQIKNYFDTKSSNEYDFIYQRLSRSNYLAFALRRNFDLPIVIEYNGSEAWASSNWGHKTLFPAITRKAELRTLFAADLVVTVSKVLRDELISEGIKKERVVYYPNCVNGAEFNPQQFSSKDKARVRSNFDVDDNSIVVGFIGTFGTWHGIPFLCSAIRNLVDTEYDWVKSNKLVFVICGDGHHTGLVRELAKNPKYSEFIKWPGLIPQGKAAEFLSITDILLSPHVSNNDGSAFFGSPTKIFEYMASAKPIIAADLDQISEIFSDAIKLSTYGQLPKNISTKASAMLFPPGNKERFLQCIKTLVERPDLRALLGSNAMELSNEKYQWSNHVDEIFKAMKRLP